MLGRPLHDAERPATSSGGGAARLGSRLNPTGLGDFLSPAEAPVTAGHLSPAHLSPSGQGLGLES